MYSGLGPPRPQEHCRSQSNAKTQKTQHRSPGPDLQNILRQSYDYLTIMPKLRSTYDGRLIYKTSYEELKAFLRHDSPAELYDRLRQCSQITLQ